MLSPTEELERYFIKYVLEDLPREPIAGRINLLREVFLRSKYGIQGDLSKVILYNLAMQSGLLEPVMKGHLHAKDANGNQLYMLASSVVDVARVRLSEKLAELDCPNKDEIEKVKRRMDTATYLESLHHPLDVVAEDPVTTETVTTTADELPESSIITTLPTETEGI